MDWEKYKERCDKMFVEALGGNLENHTHYPDFKHLLSTRVSWFEIKTDNFDRVNNWVKHRYSQTKKEC